MNLDADQAETEESAGVFSAAFSLFLISKCGIDTRVRAITTSISKSFVFPTPESEKARMIKNIFTETMISVDFKWLNPNCSII